MPREKRTWTPFEIGRRVLIKPPDTPEIPHRLNITIGAGRAFGSGEHETTRQCLELMTGFQFLPRHRALDYGAGTGILAIAAAKLGAASVIALDNEFEAAQACRRNSELNGMDENIREVCGALQCLNDALKFDIILANLYADILLDSAQTIKRLLVPSGLLLLSGIDFEHWYDIKTSFENLNFKIVEQKLGNDYGSIVFRNLR